MVMPMEKENLSAGSPPSPKTTSSPEKRTRPMPEDGNQGRSTARRGLGGKLHAAHASPSSECDEQGRHDSGSDGVGTESDGVTLPASHQPSLSTLNFTRGVPQAELSVDQDESLFEQLEAPTTQRQQRPACAFNSTAACAVFIDCDQGAHFRRTFAALRSDEMPTMAVGREFLHGREAAHAFIDWAQGLLRQCSVRALSPPVVCFPGQRDGVPEHAEGFAIPPDLRSTLLLFVSRGMCCDETRRKPAFTHALCETRWPQLARISAKGFDLTIVDRLAMATGPRIQHLISGSSAWLDRQEGLAMLNFKDDDAKRQAAAAAREAAAAERRQAAEAKRQAAAAAAAAREAVWEVGYARLVAYKAEHGDCLVPKGYKAAGGVHLGNWVSSQRKVYKGTRYGTLGASRVTRLEALGMVWNPTRRPN